MGRGEIIEIAELPEALQKVVGELIPELGLQLSKATMRALQRTIVETSPVEHPGTGRHPGKYRASHVISPRQPAFVDLPDAPSYPIPGELEADAQMAGALPGDDLYIATHAVSDGDLHDRGYSDILEGGRVQYSRVRTHTTMWMGSEQAPEGVYYPAVKVVAELHATIEAEAIKATEEALGLS